jgi:hypothetical protein
MSNSVLEEIPVSADEILEIHRKLDLLANALNESKEQRAAMTVEMKQMCDCLKTLNDAVLSPDGIRARLTKVEGKVGVGQWLVMTAGSILMACLIGGIWAIAVRI